MLFGSVMGNVVWECYEQRCLGGVMDNVVGECCWESFG